MFEILQQKAAQYERIISSTAKRALAFPSSSQEAMRLKSDSLVYQIRLTELREVIKEIKSCNRAQV